MRKLLLTAAATGALGLTVLSAPAIAQVHLGVGPDGVEVGAGRDHDRDWDGRWHHREYRGAYASDGDCRVIRDRTVTPSGRTITRTKRICD
jgi:hypothetical protein